MPNSILTNTHLSSTEYERYARQIIINEINIQGQKKLKNAKIICIGAGGLNTPALLYLTACGIGTIGIIDYDKINISNLHRQILYRTDDLNKTKVTTAYQHLRCLNPLIKINIFYEKLNHNNIINILSNYDIIIDGTDNLNSRYLISQYSYQLHKIHVYGAIEKFIGQVSIFNYQNGCHYYNLYNQLSYNRLNSCSETGIINTLAGTIGILQATETIKIITGIGSILNRYLLVFNLLNLSFNKTKITPNKLDNNLVIKCNTNYIINPQKYISVKDIQTKINLSYQLIDIRTPIEFKLKKINHAINIPLQKLKKTDYIQYLKNTQKKQIIIIYCNNNIRSYIASQILTKNDIEHYILKDGTQNIKEREGFEPSLSNT